jgi:hypothetical protein
VLGMISSNLVSLMLMRILARPILKSFHAQTLNLNAPGRPLAISQTHVRPHYTMMSRGVLLQILATKVHFVGKMSQLVIQTRLNAFNTFL